MNKEEAAIKFCPGCHMTFGATLGGSKHPCRTAYTFLFPPFSVCQQTLGKQQQNIDTGCGCCILLLPLQLPLLSAGFCCSK